jgi:hypothetical protein
LFRRSYVRSVWTCWIWLCDRNVLVSVSVLVFVLALALALVLVGVCLDLALDFISFFFSPFFIDVNC